MLDFIHIRSNKFPALAGEDEELVNDGMYGKALSQYLQAELTSKGYDIPIVFPEDWGWWVEIDGLPFALGVCVYSNPEQDNPTEFVCTDSLLSARKWSWKAFGYIETRPAAEKLLEDLKAIFLSDPDVEIVQITEDMPF